MTPPIRTPPRHHHVNGDVIVRERFRCIVCHATWFDRIGPGVWWSTTHNAWMDYDDPPAHPTRFPDGVVAAICDHHEPDEITTAHRLGRWVYA